MTLQTQNTIWSIIQHLVAVVCGLILPREILAHYGSEMNGVVHSISQFLSYTVLLELGIGAVIPVSLYQPLAEGNHTEISAILSSGRKVYRRIAWICIVYVFLLLLLFPKWSGISSSTLLIVILGIGTVVHYFAGMPESFLIISDQKGYIVYRLATVSIVLNTLFQVILIRAGLSLAIVKLGGTLVSVGQMILLCLYARWHYQIDWKIQYQKEPILQKWNGIAQHVAYFILENTDIILLTLFTTFREVSVYSVYFMVISGVRSVFSSITYSIQPKLGALKSKGSQEDLIRFFTKFERWIHITTAFMFSLLGLILVPFVRAYTDGISDADYTRPLFAVLLSVAYGLQSIRDPYDKLILASGHFKQTQANYIIASSLNMGISLLAVQIWGLEGVAAGTLIAMAYQMVYMASYDAKVLLKRSGWVFIQNLLLDVAIIAFIILFAHLIPIPYEDLFRWILSFVRG